jgi:hypothetical protein
MPRVKNDKNSYTTLRFAVNLTRCVCLYVRMYVRIMYVCMCVCVYVSLLVRLSAVGMKQLNSHWTDFLSLVYLSIFRKSIAKIQILLMFVKVNGSFT